MAALMRRTESADPAPPFADFRAVGVNGASTVP
jgi:hypothetical protein